MIEPKKMKELVALGYNPQTMEKLLEIAQQATENLSEMFEYFIKDPNNYVFLYYPPIKNEAELLSAFLIEAINDASPSRMKGALGSYGNLFSKSREVRNLEIMKNLLALGASPSKVSEFFPLDEAVSWNFPDAVEMLLKAGANIHDISFSWHEYPKPLGYSLYHHELTSKTISIISLLLAAGADVNENKIGDDEETFLYACIMAASYEFRPKLAKDKISFRESVDFLKMILSYSPDLSLLCSNKVPKTLLEFLREEYADEHSVVRNALDEMMDELKSQCAFARVLLSNSNNAGKSLPIELVVKILYFAQPDYKTHRNAKKSALAYAETTDRAFTKYLETKQQLEVNSESVLMPTLRRSTRIKKIPEKYIFDKTNCSYR